MSLWTTLSERHRPLADRMRPRTLKEYVGQSHIIGPGRLLRRAIEADQLSSVIFHGPPGTGKTTLARVIAGTTQAHFIALNAVLAGVKDIRQAITEASARRDQRGQRTILFVDEVHRFSKSQQDALLPWVENGTVTLIGATTENPYFEVNKALVSRSRIFLLEPLGPEELDEVVGHALGDPSRGYGKQHIDLAEDARAHLVHVANGDARALLNALELAVETTPPDDSGCKHIDLAVAEESIQQRAVLYDKEGDTHFDTISAFIKSVRGSDPDASLYWLAKMVYAGEDPRFLFRRLIILASEDIGLADPQALGVVMAAASAFDRIGMPEGRYHLAQATLYLATAPKSNSTMGFFDALKAVQDEASDEVPNHLKDTARDAKAFGHGAGYLYPHAYRDHWVAQQYLPSALQGRLFYEPSDQGHEATIRERLSRQRDAMIAAMSEAPISGPLRLVTSGPEDPELERWIARTQGGTGERLAATRDAMFDAAPPARHHVVLDAGARTGLLTFEAVRRCPEGGVWSWVQEPAHAETLRGLAARLPALVQPCIVQGQLEELETQCVASSQRFDRVYARDMAGTHPDRLALFTALAGRLGPHGRIVCHDMIPRHAQRLHALADTGDAALTRAWKDAEDAMYHDEDDPLTSWDLDHVVAAARSVGLTTEGRILTHEQSLHIRPAMIERWFAPRPTSYASRLARHLSPEQIAGIRHAITRTLLDRTVTWRTTSGLCVAQRA